jgi:repressor LexA
MKAPSRPSRRSASKTDVWLVSQNPAHTPIPGDHATIIGKVVAVLRRV